MLDIECRPDVDAGSEQLVDVLPALRMAAARHVGVGVFVDQQQARPPRERRVEIELLHHLIAVDERLARQDFEAVDQLLGLAPAVRLDQAGDDVAAPGLLAARGRQHGVCLADAGRRAEKNLQAAAPFLVGEGQQRIGRSSLRLAGRPSALVYDRSLSSARLSLSTLTRGSPRRPSVRPLTWLFTRARTRSSGRPAPWRSAAPGSAQRPARCPGRGRCPTSSRDRRERGPTRFPA